MGICVMNVRVLLNYIFEDYNAFALLDIDEQQTYWDIIKNRTSTTQYAAIFQYHKDNIDTLIRIRAEDAQELCYLLHQE